MGNGIASLIKELNWPTKTLQLTHVFKDCILSSKEQLELLSTSHAGLIQNASLIYMTGVTSDSLENMKDFSSEKNTMG